MIEEETAPIKIRTSKKSSSKKNSAEKSSSPKNSKKKKREKSQKGSNDLELGQEEVKIVREVVETQKASCCTKLCIVFLIILVLAASGIITLGYLEKTDTE